MPHQPGSAAPLVSFWISFWMSVSARERSVNHVMSCFLALYISILCPHRTMLICHRKTIRATTKRNEQIISTWFILRVYVDYIGLHDSTQPYVGQTYLLCLYSQHLPTSPNKLNKLNKLNPSIPIQPPDDSTSQVSIIFTACRSF